MSLKTYEYRNVEKMAEFLAKDMMTEIQKAIQLKGSASLVLSGGRTPLKIFELIKKSPREVISFQNCEIYWLDERYVPHEHEKSNFGSANRALFNTLKVKKLYPFPTNLSLEACARSYEKTLKDSKDFPHFDYALLGFGEDGHMASLFQKEDDSKDKLVVSSVDPQGLPRLSMTSRVFNKAHKKVLMGSGPRKKSILDDYLSHKSPSLPLHLLEKENLHIHFAS